MDKREILEDITYRLSVDKTIKELEEQLENGEHDDNPLIDLVLFYRREIDQLNDELKRVYKELKEKE